MKIFAIGMNYALHNKALHGTLSKPEEPVIFLKADTALLKATPEELDRIAELLRAEDFDVEVAY